jgi:hypothetical protein
MEQLAPGQSGKLQFLITFESQADILEEHCPKQIVCWRNSEDDGIYMSFINERYLQPVVLD